MKVQKTIGIVGGGQLGRMLTMAALPLGFKVIVVDPVADCPAKQAGAQQILASLYDQKAIKKLARLADYITIEIEHLNADILKKIKKPVNPAPATIQLIQDKYKQRQFLAKNGFPVAKFQQIKSLRQAEKTLKEFGGTMFLKTRKNAFDGRGNALVKSSEELKTAYQDFKGADLYAEKLVPFKKELAAIIAKDTSGNIQAFPLVQTIHERSICTEVLCPAPISSRKAKKAIKVATEAVKKLKGSGVFAVEMFLLKGGKILINEIAPRVHNSGHYTMDGCSTSQFEQHIRAVTELPLADTSLKIKAICMINILGERSGRVKLRGVKKALSDPNVYIHLYGKSPTKVDRKMGHINAVSNKLKKARKSAKIARNQISI